METNEIALLEGKLKLTVLLAAYRNALCKVEIAHNRTSIHPPRLRELEAAERDALHNVLNEFDRYSRAFDTVVHAQGEQFKLREAMQQSFNVGEFIRKHDPEKYDNILDENPELRQSKPELTEKETA
jgi:hypothetical protein